MPAANPQPSEALRVENDSDDGFRIAEFRRCMPVAFHRAEPLLRLFLEHARRFPRARLADIADTFLEKHIRNPIRDEARRVLNRWCKSASTDISIDTLENETFLLLCSPEAAAIDLSHIRLPSQYFPPFVRQAFDKLRGAESIRRRRLERNPHDPDGPPVEHRDRQSRFQAIPPELELPAPTASARGSDDLADVLKLILERMTLSDCERVIIDGHYAQGMTLKDLAGMHGMSYDALTKCHERLKQKIRLAIIAHISG